MTLTILAAMVGLSLGACLGFLAAGLASMARDTDEELNTGPDDDGSLWPRNSKGL